MGERVKKNSELDLRKELHDKQKETDILKSTVKEKLLKHEDSIKYQKLESNMGIIEKLEEENMLGIDEILLASSKVKNNSAKTQEKEQQKTKKEAMVHVSSAGYKCGNFSSISFDKNLILLKKKLEMVCIVHILQMVNGTL